MRTDFEVLNALEKSEGYKRLMMLWMEDLGDIETRRDAAASKGQESGWRYWAGQEKGYKRAMMKLSAEMALMETDGGETVEQPSDVVERLMSQVRGEMDK